MCVSNTIHVCQGSNKHGMYILIHRHQKHVMKDKHGKHVNIINGSKGLLPKPKKQLPLTPKHGGHLHQIFP